MSLWAIFILSVGLAMDACAVSLCKGLSSSASSWKNALTAGIWFGAFQAGMPLLGWLLGVRFQTFIEQFDHWVAFLLLTLLGINMLREARQEEDSLDGCFSWRTMLPLAVATSIDALAVGVTFAFLLVPILPAITAIGLITFLLSALGVRLGSLIGKRCRSWAELAGGVILIAMGLKILLEHLGVFS